jgi:hypothetical protein
MKPGTCTTRPVSSVAGLRTLVTVAVFIPGVVSTTFRSTVFGRLTPIGVVSKNSTWMREFGVR